MEVQFKLKTTMQKRTIFSNTLRANVKNMRTFVPTPTPPAKFITVGGEGAKTPCYKSLVPTMVIMKSFN